MSQCYCEATDVRQLIHSVANDDRTRVIAAGPLDKLLPLYNFCPPGVMTKLND